MKKIVLLLFPFTFVCLVFGHSTKPVVPGDLTQYVDPMIGTALQQPVRR